MQLIELIESRGNCSGRQWNLTRELQCCASFCWSVLRVLWGIPNHCSGPCWSKLKALWAGAHCCPGICWKCSEQDYNAALVCAERKVSKTYEGIGLMTCGVLYRPSHQSSQLQIQDFPLRGRQPHWGGGISDVGVFMRKCIENSKNWVSLRGECQGRPLDPLIQEGAMSRAIMLCWKKGLWDPGRNRTNCDLITHGVSYPLTCWTSCCSFQFLLTTMF